MKIIADLHTHTIASTHAYGTIQEMVQQAKKIGLSAIAITDHAPAMPDAPHAWYFTTLPRLPLLWDDGFVMLRGAEANVMNHEGDLDLQQQELEKLDWIIASMHPSCIAPMDEETSTNVWLRVAENPYVDLIGHSEQWQYKYDYDRVTKAFAANHKVVEINANSVNVRPGNEKNLRQLVLCCKQNGAKISINSDAHMISEVGRVDHLFTVLEEAGFPEENIINSSKERLLAEWKLHGKPFAADVPW